MFIKVSNVRDFINFIHDAIHNGERFPRVLHSNNPSYAPIHFSGQKDHIDFVYALFTTKLQVIFSGKVTAEEFEMIDRKMQEYRNHEDNFRIQVFRSIKFDGSVLHVEEELSVI